MLKKYMPYTIGFYLAAVVTLITASFVDLKLDIAVNNPTDPFSLWFEATGEMPCRLIGVIAGVLIYYIGEKKIVKLLGFLINMGCATYLGYHIASYFFKEENNVLFGIVFGIGIGIVAQYLGQFITISEEMKKGLFILSVTGVIVMFVQLGCIEVVKTVWGRVRFRDLLAVGSYDAFSQWYVPKGITGHRSFPSGHTAGAAMSYLMMLLPYVSEKWKKRRALCFIIPLIYTSIVAYTRLVMGAHYLSDVAMGGVIGFTTVIIAIAVLDKKFFKTEE